MPNIKISELPELIDIDEADEIAIVDVDAGITKKITRANFLRFLNAEYQELSNWLDDVTLGSNGLTTIPEIVLEPRSSALDDIIGGMYFSDLDNSIYVCISL